MANCFVNFFLNFLTSTGKKVVHAETKLCPSLRIDEVKEA